MEKTKEDNSALRFLIVLILGTLALALVSGFKPYEPPQEANKTITVYAAAGTTVAVRQIADLYEQQTGCKVVTNFASSSTLARQIAAGAEFDVYISANIKWMDFVQENKLINIDSRTDLLTERLVLVAAKDSIAGNENLLIAERLTQTDGLISIGDPGHVPLGIYTKQVLENIGCWDTIADRTVPAVSVRAAQQNVETGQCELGIVYRAGAVQSDKLCILTEIDPSLHDPIRFIMATAAGSQTGTAFIHYLKTSAAERIFASTGYTTTCRPTSDTHTSGTSSGASAYTVDEWQAFLISLKVAATCTLVVAAPGIALGYWLAGKPFRGQSLINALVCVPMVIPPVVTGYLALMLLGKNSVIGHWLDNTFGVSLAFSWFGAVTVSAIMGFPLLVRSVKTAVEMIDYRYRHAANTLGAGPVRAFFTITLPLAGPGILAGLILAFARSLGEFGATAIFAGNIPGKTQTLSLAIYNFTQIPGAESAAMRLVALSVLLSLAAMLGSELLSHKMKALLGAQQ